MYTIKNDIVDELIVNNSRFITLLYKIDDISIFPKIMDNCKKLYPDANHYCYAYIIDEIKKSSDDGEPSGTAGVPILKVLENNKLNNVLCIVVRYFGGIKLGANGLIRAYTKGCANAIKKSLIVKLVSGYNLNITFDYDQIKDIDFLLKDYVINNKIFEDKVTYNINIPKDFLTTIINYKLAYEIISEIKLEMI